MDNNEILINEGGINWTWFTRIIIEPDETVTILEHYRKHNSEEFTQDEKGATHHPEYYGSDKWEEGKGRVAIKYNVPGLGWKVINNQKYIFDYKKEESQKPPTIDEAKVIIEQIAEEKKSMMEIMLIVEKSADEKFKSTNPEYYSIRDQIYEEELFDKLRNKIEEKKKLTNYPNGISKEETKLHIDIQTIEQSLYDTYKIPLFKVGLLENLSQGFEWLVDEILLSYAKFDADVNNGEKAVLKLFPSPSGKSYEFSDDAKLFSDFLRAEREDYKIFATEFIKKMCGK
jgi:hypothetical protein